VAHQGGGSNSLVDRLNYTLSGFEMWFDRPLQGWGAGTYGDVHPGYQQRVVSASTNAHNLYVQVLAELGLVGAVLLAAVLLWLAIGMLRGLVEQPSTVPIALGVGGLLLHLGLDIDASYPALLGAAAVLCGLVYRQWWSVRRRAGLGGPVLAAMVLAPLISLYQSDVWAARAQAAEDDGDYARAAEQYEAAHRGLVYDPDYVNAEGIALYARAAMEKRVQGEAALALDRARMSERMDAYDAQHHQLEGRVLALQGDLGGAQKAFREALRLDPYNHPEYALDLATTQAAAGDVGGAVQTAEEMLGLYPAEVVSNRNLDTALRPVLANLAAFVGNVYLSEGQWAKARVAAERALEYDSQSLRARALMVQVRKH
jgi:tetratricopeptide (TPR) repeat protein